MVIYVVKKGDTLSKIANEFGVNLRRLREINGIFGDMLSVGTALYLPTEMGAHIVKRGDSLYSIALEYGTTVEELLRLNPKLKPPYVIYPDQYIIVPKPSKLREIEVNGYCYPSIREDALRNTLPYLTYISIFSYRLSPDGNLEGINDDKIIRIAKENNVAPLLTITNTKSSGGFDSETVDSFLKNDNATEGFINGIPSFIKEKGYMGINVDFEYIPEDDRELYNNFLRRLSRRFKAEGLIVLTAVAPKLSEEQRGRLYEAHDYRAHGEYTDRVVIMTYEWGYIAGPPMAVAPINEVEKVLRYARSEIPSEKILMGMPNYAYDWTLPFREGTNARILSLSAAQNLAISTRSQIEFNETAKAPFFTYRDSGGREHIVWFDDVRSFKDRLLLIDEYNLAGVSFWTINNFWAPGYYVLSNLYDIKKLI